MTKFRTDVTKGGLKILTLYGLGSDDKYAGIVENEGCHILVQWDENGVAADRYNHYNLIPLTGDNQ